MGNKVKEYMVVVMPGAQPLVDRVTDLIKQGWQPQGGVSFSLGGQVNGFAQAMVLYDNQQG